MVIFTSNTYPMDSKFFDDALISRLVIVDTDRQLLNVNRIKDNYSRIIENYSRKLMFHSFHSYCKEILNTITNDEID